MIINKEKINKAFLGYEIDWQSYEYHKDIDKETIEKIYIVKNYMKFELKFVDNRYILRHLLGLSMNYLGGNGVLLGSDIEKANILVDVLERLEKLNKGV